MNILKGFLITLSIFALFGSLIDKVVLAAEYDWPATKQQIGDMAKDSPVRSFEDIYRILATIVKYVYEVFFVVAVLFILIAAFNFLFARGDPERIKSARSQILYAVIAIVIALLSVGAEAIIKDLLGKGASPSSIPQVPVPPGYYGPGAPGNI